MNAGDLGRVAASLDDPFSDGVDGAPRTRGLALAPGWTASTSFSGATKVERERRPPLDRDADAFSSRLTRSFASGAAVSSTVETNPGMVGYTLEARREIRRTLAHGRLLMSTIEVGFERETATGRGAYAAFAQQGGPPIRAGHIPIAKNTFWANWKTAVELAPKLSVTAELEAENGSDGRNLLGYFGLKTVW